MARRQVEGERQASGGVFEVVWKAGCTCKNLTRLTCWKWLLKEMGIRAETGNKN